MATFPALLSNRASSRLVQRGLVHAKLDDLYAAVDDVTEAFKLQRDNATYKQHMGDLAQKLAHHVAAKCVLRCTPTTNSARSEAQQASVIAFCCLTALRACAREQWAARR